MLGGLRCGALWRRPHRGLALARAARLTSRVDYRLGGLRSRGSDFRRGRALVAWLRAAGGGQWRQRGVVVVLAVGVGGHAGVVIVSAVWQEPRGGQWRQRGVVVVLAVGVGGHAGAVIVVHRHRLGSLAGTGRGGGSMAAARRCCRSRCRCRWSRWSCHRLGRLTGAGAGKRAPSRL